MHKVIMTFLSILGLMTILVPADAAIVDQVLATVNNEAITLSDYKRFISETGSPASPERVDESLLKKLIDDKIIKEFQNSNNLSDEEFKKKACRRGYNNH